jgi:CHASE3 domain sensor protein
MQIFPASIRGKLILGFGLLTVITLILGVADYRTLIVLDRAADEMERKSLERTLTDEIDQASAKEGNSVRGFLLTGDEGMLETEAAERRHYGEASRKLLELTKSESSNALVEDIRDAHERYWQIAEREFATC